MNLTKQWRPITALTFTLVVFVHYVIFPILSIVPAPLPDHLWEVIKIFAGLYAFGRSAEKVVEQYKKS